MIKLKVATEWEQQKTQFVENMEELEVKKLNMVVLVSSLTSRVLSTVAEVAKVYQNNDGVASKESGGYILTMAIAASFAESVPILKENAKAADSSVPDDDE